MGIFKVPYSLANLNEKVVHTIVTGIGTLAVFYGFYRLIRYFYEEDEYFKKITWQGGADQRRILVLGMDDAGKTRLLQCFQRGLKPGDILPEPESTISFNIRSAGIAGIDYHFWDVSGTETSRRKWCQFLYDIDVLLWVVDSSNPQRFKESKDSLHELIEMMDKQEEEHGNEVKECRSNYGLPVVIVASKQDKEQSIPPSVVYDEMDAEKFTNKHKDNGENIDL